MSAERFFQYFGLPLIVYPLKQTPVQAHNHEFCEIAVILKGQGMHECNRSFSPIAAGDVLFIPQGIAHGYDKTDVLELVNILYLPSRLGISGLDIASSEFYGMVISNKIPPEKNLAVPIAHLNPDELAGTQRLCRRLKKEHEECAYGHEFACQSLFMELLLLFSRSYERRKNRKAAATQNRIGNIIAYLNRHYHEKISLKILACKTGMSQRNMIRLFEIATGATPINYLLHLRIYQATIMLRTTTLNISEIAEKCGFNDSNYFTRQFHRLTCKPPSLFRKASESKLKIDHARSKTHAMEMTDF
jgi:AraC-like DNA-binding protein